MPQSLLGRSAFTIALTLLIFMLVSLGSAIYFIAIPMAKRSADDFAAVIVSAAHSIQSLPEEMHAELQRQLLQDHGLIVTTKTRSLPGKTFDVPYYMFFQESLARRVGQKLSIIESTKGPLIWVDVPAHDMTVRIGFDRTRLGTNPPIVLLAIIGGSALLILLVSFMEVRRVAEPLASMSATVQAVGRGHNPPALSEDGPKEIAALARAFNQMSSDIQELSENRTVIVAGISHDLRTPLTRLELAVEMLSEDSDPTLVAGIRRDLAAMNRLIAQFLQFSRGIEDERPEDLDLWRVIESQSADIKRQGVELRLHRNDPPCVYFADPVALERVLANLLGNAAQYGRGAPIDVNLNCTEKEVSIKICDRGPGIPADQVEAVFRPFRRLETARSDSNGGSGLGLAIARQLAVKHGWTIDLLPRNGGGTVARLGLPPSQRRCTHNAVASAVT
jgi:two-component system osmolarity sensor histidine kinase EnvZ